MLSLHYPFCSLHLNKDMSEHMMHVHWLCTKASGDVKIQVVECSGFVVLFVLGSF